MTEEETIGAGARTGLQSISGPAAVPISFFEGGGGICKGYMYSRAARWSVLREPGNILKPVPRRGCA